MIEIICVKDLKDLKCTVNMYEDGYLHNIAGVANGVVSRCLGLQPHRPQPLAMLSGDDETSSPHWGSRVLCEWNFLGYFMMHQYNKL